MAWIAGSSPAMTEEGAMRDKGHPMIPKTLRDALSLNAGDVERVGANRAGIADRAKPTELDPFVAFNEWASEEDERLYRGL
jgi:hypothetical protein